ncbi:TetR/AcrR family transcriptional regulator [Roseobacteraceae bacterium S113]
MNEASEKMPRGRPKTFDRDHVVAVAMQAYWEEGITEVSLNALCRRAGVSKPSLYKEFGSEDGLKHVVLAEYHKRTLAPLYEIVAQEQPFAQTLDALTEYILRDHAECGMPNGCLFADMCQCRAQLGALTRAQVDEFQALSLRIYEEWIERAKATGQLASPVSARVAATYIDTQIAAIMSLQRQGASQSDISAVFRLALSVLE